MICRDAQLDLTAWVDGELSPQEVHRLEAHLRECANCRRASDSVHALRDAVRLAAPPSPAVALAAPAGSVVRQYVLPAVAAAAVFVLIVIPQWRGPQVISSPGAVGVPSTAVVAPSLVGLDCRIASPGPGCQIEIPPSYCSSARDCGLPF